MFREQNGAVLRMTSMIAKLHEGRNEVKVMLDLLEECKDAGRIGISGHIRPDEIGRASCRERVSAVV